ncbi:Acyl-CoA dehydrogenase [Purpureocillium lavendulum]|uniref:Acyl-CoA dehydrogenase n=1 Tax=Purpureocillium lavendulum TaxID=1247861 RepID=A0AB34G1I1_9HYPO|nr:Acyl-CoA dehydrogenase [Purpureocillium lavendulum]
MAPSTVDTGYRLQPAPLANPVTTDTYLRRVLQWYLGPQRMEKILPQLTQFGDEAASDTVHAWIANSEKEEPYVKQYDTWGRRYPYDKLVTSEGWKRLGEWGAMNGEHPFHDVFQRLIARENAWVSSQWMTERPGGSDVRNSETVAVYSPVAQKSTKFGKIDEGDYVLSGFKWFTSAADCDVALILAKTDSGELSLFLAPTRVTVKDPDGKPYQVTNGVRIHRMKNKMGTKELPTAELQLNDVRAWMIGPKDKGISTIALLLNVTRTHNFITALSCWRRAMHIAKSFAKARTVLDQPLWTFPMHLRLLSNMEVKHRGALQLAFFTTSLLSFADYGSPESTSASYIPLPEPGRPTEVLLRTLTATTKAIVCKVSTLALQECQEAMGGVGYLDDPDDPEFNISRLFRDTAANMTWEGTTNVLASEVIRHVLNKDHLDILANWMRQSISRIADSNLKNSLAHSSRKFVDELGLYRNNIGAALADGRQQMFTLGWLISGILLALDAQRDHDDVASEVAKRWILRGRVVLVNLSYPASCIRSSRKLASTKQSGETGTVGLYGMWNSPRTLLRDSALWQKPDLWPTYPTIRQKRPIDSGSAGEVGVETDWPMDVISDGEITSINPIAVPDFGTPHSRISHKSQAPKAYEIPTANTSYDGRNEYLGDEVSVEDPTIVAQSSFNQEHGLPDLDVRFLTLRKAFDLPPRTIRESLIDAFMEHCHPWTPIVDRRWLEESDQRRPSMLLLQAVFLAGSRVLSSPFVYASSSEFYERARALFFHRHEKNTTLAIVAVCLLQWWNPTGPERFSVNTSGFWVRIGVELAYQVGLHKEPAEGPFRSFRRRLWWTLVIRDSIISVGTGRPRTIHLEDSTMKPPTLEDFAVQNTQARLFIAYASIFRQRLEDGLFRWVKQLPTQLQIVHHHEGTRIPAPYNFESRQLSVPYFVSLILLHRSPKTHATASTVCLMASSYVVSTIEEFLCRDQLRYLGPVFTFYALVTGLDQLTGFRYNALQETAEHEFNVIKVALEELGKRWGSAHGALRGLLRAKEAIQQQPRLTGQPPRLSPEEAVFFADFGPDFCKLWDVGFSTEADQVPAAAALSPSNARSWDYSNASLSLSTQPPSLMQNPKTAGCSRGLREEDMTDASGFAYEDSTQFEDPLVPAEGFWLFEDLELPGIFSDSFPT